MGDHHHHHHHDHSHHSDHTDMLNATINATVTTVASVASALVTTVASVLTQTPNESDMVTGNINFHDNMNHGTTDSPDHSGHGHDGVSGMSMQMYFYIGKSATILFKEWKVDSVGGMIGSVFGVILMGILYEGLKFLREHLSRQFYSRMSYSTCTVSGQVEKTGRTELHKYTENRILSWHHILQTFLHIAQVLLGYFLMFIFMTYNVWLCLAILIGSGIGYFCFGWKKATLAEISDHCH